MGRGFPAQLRRDFLHDAAQQDRMCPIRTTQVPDPIMPAHGWQEVCIRFCQTRRTRRDRTTKGTDMKSKILGLLAVGLLAGPMSAGAVIVKWTLDNAVFNDGTVASGWFDYDSAAGSAVDWLIVTQDGTRTCGGGFSGGGAESFAGFTYDRTSGSAFSFFGDSKRDRFYW